MAEIRQVPAIRFNGFNNEWSTDLLGELSDVYDGTHQTPIYTNSGVMFLSVENIQTLKSDKYISKEAFEKEFKTYPQSGDVLMTRIGDIGTANVVDSKEPIAYYVSLALLKQKKLHPYFLKHSISTHTVVNDLWRRTLHIAFPKKINKNEIAKVEIPFPIEDEQAQIGSYFQHLDKLISLHQTKVNKLTNLKKAMLEKMFPKQGADVPEIRFKGFAGAWEERPLLDKLERVIDFRGRTPKKLGMDWSESGYLALSALNVKNGFIDKNIDAHYGNQELYDKWMYGSELHKHQVLMTTEAPMGNIAQIPDNNRYILSQRTIAFVVVHELITEDFLAVSLSTDLNFRKLTQLSSGGTAKGVSQKSLSSMDIFVPKNTDEQSKIGSYFKKLDELLRLHQTELEKLNNLKKACLERMFV